MAKADEKDKGKDEAEGKADEAGKLSAEEETARKALEVETAKKAADEAAATVKAKEEAEEAKKVDDEDRRIIQSVSDDDELGPEHDRLSPEEREALRERRRDERRHRKEAQRQRIQEKDRRIEDLRRQNEELLARVTAVEKRGISSDMAQLEAAIEEAKRVAAGAREEMKKAIAGQDGEAMTQAQEAWYVAQRRSENLTAVRQRIIQSTSRGADSSVAPKVDRMVARHAEQWATRNAWYDPELRDADSRIARTLDESLHEEGWDPRTQEYWDEFSSRLQKYLPHRVKRGTFRGDGERGNSAGNRADSDGGGSPTGGASRESASVGGKGFTLSSERIQAIKDAGMWDDVKKRDRMIQRFKTYDKAQAS